MICGTWNVQSLSRKVNEIINELKHLKVDIAVFTETKKKGRGSENWGNYDHFYSGVSKDSRAKQGVSVVIHRRFRKFITTWEPINERIIKINLSIYGYKVTILGIYAVNEDELIHNKDIFFEQLNDEIVKIGTSREIILLGDFNGRVGRKANDDVVGKFGEEVVNDNGRRLITICEQNQLRILNGYFQHREIHKYTWTQTTRNLKTIIDYIITKQKSRLKFIDVRVNRGASCGSDHYFLKAKMVAPIRTKDQQENTHGNEEEEKEVKEKEIRYNLSSLEQESTRRLYKTRLNNKLQITDFDNIEEQYEYIKTCIHSAAVEALGCHEKRENREKPYWWDEEIEFEIEEKRKKYHTYLSSKNMNDKLTYKEAQARVRKMISTKKNEKWERTCSRLNAYIGGRKSTESWRLLKNMRQERRKDIISPISAQTWNQYFEKMLTEDRQVFKDAGNVNHNVVTQGSPVRISISEVKEICSSLKNGRAPGPGNIPGELIKYGTDKLYHILRDLFQRCINKSEVPEEWMISYISTVHKKGDKSNCDNYRGISVTNSISRIYGKILKNRIENEYREMEAEEQAGFRVGRSTIDHLFTITQILEKKTAYNQEVHLLYVDLKKAYDSVPLVKLWETLQHTNINIELTKAVKSLYANTISKIKIGNSLTSGFLVNKGLKQGCCLSPTLFKIYLEHALMGWKRKCHNMGIPVDDTSTLYTLSFADDQVVIAQDIDDMEYMARKLIEEYEKWGLEVNVQKTEYMCIGGQQQDLLLSGEQKIKHCNEYKYLGMKISNDGTLDEAISERNTQGRRAISILNSILWDKHITKENKRRIYNSIVKSIVTYSCEVWPIKEKTERTLRATEMDFWRRSAGKSRRERVTNERIRNMMGITHDIVDDIRTKQLIWYGHVQRMSHDRIPKKLLNWNPQGRRKRGRPRRSWREGIDNEVRVRDLDEELWRDRDEWRLGIGRRRRTL